MAKSAEIAEGTVLHYQMDDFDPLEKLDFILLDGFARAWKSLKLTDLDLSVLRAMIAAAPKGAPAIKGTGGLRKLRFRNPRSNRGKSAGYRVCYAYFEEFGIALLVQIYAKSCKDDLTPAECNEIKRQLEQFARNLENNPLS